MKQKKLKLNLTFKLTMLVGIPIIMLGTISLIVSATMMNSELKTATMNELKATTEMIEMQLKTYDGLMSVKNNTLY